MVEPDSSFSIYVGKGDPKVIESFDEYYRERADGAYSRSRRVIEAMQLLQAVDETLEDLEWPEMPPRSKRHAVKQALLDKDRREREADG